MRNLRAGCPHAGSWQHPDWRARVLLALHAGEHGGYHEPWQRATSSLVRRRRNSHGLVTGVPAAVRGCETKGLRRRSLRMGYRSSTGSGSPDLTPQLGGDLDLNGKNLDFPSVPNIADCLDDDTMAANSAVALVTQQSVKAYANTVGAASLAKSTSEATMTLTTAVPVTPADVAAATTILLAPLGGAGITINDGSLWKDITLSQLSHTVTGAHSEQAVRSVSRLQRGALLN